MRVGVLGGGQLGRMLGLAGIPLGLELRFLDPSPAAGAAAAGELHVGGYDDADALARFAEGLDVATYEFENVPVDAARSLAGRVAVHPSPAALEVAQDRLTEKAFFRQLDIPTAPFAPVGSSAELAAAVVRLGLPAVLKTRRMGYDGKGQALLSSPEDLAPAWERLGGAPLVLEAFVPFDRELSVLAARGRKGELACYPLVENLHRDGILRRSRAPAPETGGHLAERAREYARRCLESLGYVGVLAIELFQLGEELLANEMAPRVHNSGHWTIEGAETSQFENHLRAVAGWSLGPTSARGHAVMVNLIGTLPGIGGVLEVPGAHLHLYGKAPRPGRKLGHVTLRADEEADLTESLERLEALLWRGEAGESP